MMTHKPQQEGNEVTDREGQVTNQGMRDLLAVSKIGYVRDAVGLMAALDRVRAAHEAWEGYAGNPTREIAAELLSAARAVTFAMRRFER